MKRRKRMSKKGLRLKLKPATIYSIAQISFFALAGLVIVSFARQGVILIRLNDILLEFFGWSTLFLPFVFISFGFLISKFKTPLGQPNVIVGSLLFFFSVAAAGQAGTIGRLSWDGISSLITDVGGFIILLGTAVVGLVIMFNTSLDQVIGGIVNFLGIIRRYLLGTKNISFSKPSLSRRNSGELKIMGMDSGENQGFDGQRGSKLPSQPVGIGELESKLVSNTPGEDQAWKYPPLSILTGSGGGKADRGDIKANAEIIERILESFGITAKVSEVNLGPAVTQYALEVALGTKLSKITALERDLALALAAPTGTIRIEAPIPGRSLVGIELPNRTPEFVPLKRIMESQEMKEAKSKLVVSLGLDVAGKPVLANLAKMPHVLIAGQTGSGKSVCINTFLASLLFRASPAELKLILIDPKRVELTGYNGIPHLLAPVIVDLEKVVSALKWTMAEMDRRYKLFSEAGVRNIDAYNEMSGFQALPYVVLMVDELADIMLFSPTEVEDSITRIAQMSRATGIHMVLATQRPSVDIITGLIKANIPCRIAFAVSSQVDSRVILDQQGAEKLLGRGDMLYLPPDQAKPLRIQGSFVSDSEITELIAVLRNQGVEPRYTEEVTSMPTSRSAGPGAANGSEKDELFEEAVKLVCQFERASASLLQRRLSVGYARAARIIDQLEAAGVVGPAEGSKPREVLIKNSDEVLGSSGKSSE